MDKITVKETNLRTAITEFFEMIINTNTIDGDMLYSMEFDMLDKAEGVLEKYHIKVVR